MFLYYTMDTSTFLFDFTSNLLLGIGCTVAGFAIGFAFVGIFVWHPEVKRLKEEQQEDDETTKIYERGYLEELEALEDRELSQEDLDSLRNSCLREETPSGEVIITYNSDTESFHYWADVNISFKTLDAVARKYSVENNCKSICINYKKEWERAKAAAIAQKEADEKAREEADKCKTDEEPEEDDKERSVFAKFKSYNGGSKHELNKKNSIRRRRYRINTDKCNRLTFKGRISEWNDPSVPVVQDPTCQKLSFAEFKNMGKNKKN